MRFWKVRIEVLINRKIEKGNIPFDRKPLIHLEPFEADWNIPIVYWMELTCNLLLSSSESSSMK